INLGCHGADTRFVSGMTTAHARFSADGFSASSFDLTARFDQNDRIMILTGLGFTQTGFDFAIAENYSLLSRYREYTTIRSALPEVQIPFLVAWKSRINCRNHRYFIGGGLVMNFMGDTLINEYYVAGNEVVTADTSYMSANFTAVHQARIDPRIIAGVEKVFRKGGMFSVSLVAHFGTKRLLDATVRYSLDGSSYWHHFASNGTYLGLNFSWYFRPFGWKKRQESLTSR
ncbi:MAG: hypothetical protein KKA07_14610, partial [Bacteroidetes bacterium]|nr:hypothetical protein [Bacteroidota bacterium]